MFERRLLVELREAGYNPRAWGRYVRGHARLVRTCVDARPAAVRSVLATGFTLLAVVFAGSVAATVAWGESEGRRLFLWCAVWLALHTGWLLMHLGLLEDRERRPCLRLGWPNTITLVRSATIPAMFLCMISGRLGAACLLFAAGAVSDVVDGAVARRVGPITRLGTVMDPLIDVAWITAATSGLAAAGLVPLWLLALVLVRYGLLLGGSAVLYFLRTTVRIRPTLFGKASGAAISLAMLLVLMNAALLPGALAARLAGLVHVALGFLMAATIVYVVVLGVLNFRDAQQATIGGRVVGKVEPGRRSIGAGRGH